MKYTCPFCGKRYDIRDDFLKSGPMKMRCRQCKKVMVVSEDAGGDTGETGPSKAPQAGAGTVPAAPRGLVRSVPPGTPEERAEADVEDLPVAARSGEEDLVEEFNIAPQHTKRAAGPAPTAADLPTPRKVSDLDEAFEIVGKKPPPPGTDLPVTKDGAAEESFEIGSADVPGKEAPSARPRAPSVPPEKPRVQPSAAKPLKETIAGMPSPVRSGDSAVKKETIVGMPTPVRSGDSAVKKETIVGIPTPVRSGDSAVKKETIVGIPTPVSKPEPTPGPKVDLPVPKEAISELEDPFAGISLPVPSKPGEQVEKEGLVMPGGEAQPPLIQIEEELPEFELASKQPEPAVRGMPVHKQPTPLPPVLDTPIVPLPSPVKPAGEAVPAEPFGSLDLKLGEPAGGGAEEFGALDVEPKAPPADKPFGDLGLKPKPGPAAVEEPFGVLDLPAPKEEPAEPDLPMLQEPLEPPPQPAGAKDAGLPGLSDLPTKRGAEAGDDPFASLDLPPGPESELPAEGQPGDAPLPGLRDLPVQRDAAAKNGAVDARDIFAEIKDEITTSPGTIKAPKPPAVKPIGDGTSAEASAAQETGQAGGTSFGEISLADEPTGAGTESDGAADAGLPGLRDLPTARDGGVAEQLEIDSLAATEARQRVSAVPEAEKPRKEVEEAKPARSTRGIFMLLLVLVVAGGGAALYFTGLYVDVYKFGSKLIGRDIDAMMAERAHLIGDVSAAMAGDNYEAYSGGLDRLTRSLRTSDDDVVRAYAVFLAYAIQLRFGPMETYDQAAERELRKLSLGKDMEREEILAVSAKQIFQGKDHRSAVQRLQNLGRQKGGRDADVLALLGLASLRATDGDMALQSYTALETLEKQSARALYGKVRALLLLGKAEEGEEVLFSMLKEHPDHMDSKILKAKLLLRMGTVEQAEVMLEGIEKVGEGKLGPGQVSTVNALLGQIYLGRQETTRALKRFTEADKMDPNNVEALIGLATIHLMKKEPGKALSRYKMATVVDPGNVDALLGIAECHIELAEFTQANDLLVGLNKGYPGDYRVHHLIGCYTRALQDFTQATTAFNKAIELNPAHLDSYLELASMYFEMERVSDALEILGEAKKKLPPTANLYAAFAQGYIERGELDEALLDIERAFDADPDHVQAHFLQGVALYRLEQNEAAKEALDWVAEKDPGYPGLVLQQGLLYEAMGQIEKAEKKYSEALASNPDDPEIQVRTASILVVSGKYDKAREILERVLTEDPNNPEALYYLGRVELGEDQPVVALKLIKKAIRVQPSIAVYHLYAAFAQEVNGSYSEALQSVHRSLELNDAAAVGYLMRGRLYVRMGTVKDGMADLLKALELKPTLEEAYAPLGEACESLRKWKEAIDWYQKAVVFDPDDGDIRTSLGLLLYDHGGRQEALEHFQRAVEIGRKAEGHPKWYYTALFYLGRHAQASGQKDEAKKLYKEYLDSAPVQAIDREDVEKRYEKLLGG